MSTPTPPGGGGFKSLFPRLQNVAAAAGKAATVPIAGPAVKTDATQELKTLNLIAKAIKSMNEGLKFGAGIQGDINDYAKERLAFAKENLKFEKEAVKLEETLFQHQKDRHELILEELDAKEKLEGLNDKERIAQMESLKLAREARAGLEKLIEKREVLTKAEAEGTAKMIPLWRKAGAEMLFAEKSTKFFTDAVSMASDTMAASAQDMFRTDGGMNKGFDDLLVRAYKVQGAISDVALAGVKFGYSFEDSAKLVEKSMTDIGINAKGLSLSGGELTKIGENTLFFARTLGIDTDETFKVMKLNIQNFGKTAEDAGDDLASFRMVTDSLNKANSKLNGGIGKTTIRIGDLSKAVIDAASKSGSMNTNLSTMAAITGQMADKASKAGASLNQVKDAASAMANTLANPPKHVAFFTGEAILKDLSSNMDKLDSVLEEKYGVIDQARKDFIRETLQSSEDVSIKYTILDQALGGTDAGIKQRLKMFKKYVVDAAGSAAPLVVAEFAGLKTAAGEPDVMLGAMMAKEIKEGNLDKATEMIHTYGKAGAAAAAAIEDSNKYLTTSAGGLSNVLNNIADMMKSHPLGIGLGLLGGAMKLSVVLYKGFTDIIGVLKEIPKTLRQIGGGGGGAEPEGLMHGPVQAKGGVRGALGRAGGALGRAGGRAFGGLKTGVGLGAIAALPGLVTALAESDKAKQTKGIVGSMGTLAGTAIGGALGAAILGPLGAYLGSMVGGGLGTIIADKFGDMINDPKMGSTLEERIDKAFDTMLDKVGDVLTDREMWSNLVDNIVSGLKIALSLITKAIAKPLKWFDSFAGLGSEGRGDIVAKEERQTLLDMEKIFNPKLMGANGLPTYLAAPSSVPDMDFTSVPDMDFTKPTAYSIPETINSPPSMAPGAAAQRASDAVQQAAAARVAAAVTPPSAPNVTMGPVDSAGNQMETTRRLLPTAQNISSAQAMMSVAVPSGPQ